MNVPSLRLLSLLALAAGLAGCAKGPVKPDPEAVAELREELVFEVEPADAVTALDWRDSQAEAEEASTSGKITLVGQIGGMPNPFGEGLEQEFPWKAGQASFFLVDPATVAEFVDHAGEAGEDHAADCPFCAREAATKLPALAMVSFKKDGKPIKVGAQELFGLKAGDLLVVRGVASEVGELLMIDADGLFVRE